MKFQRIFDIFGRIRAPESESMDLDELIKTRALLDEIANSVRNIVFKTFPQATPQEREDIEQEVKLKLWTNILRGKKVDNLRSYLWKVVYTTALDIVQERIRMESRTEMIQRNGKTAVERLETLSPEFIIEQKEKKEALKRYVENLAPRRKSVLQLYLTGMDLEEIAKHLNLTDNQARHLLYRGVDDLADAANGRPAGKGSK